MRIKTEKWTYWLRNAKRYRMTTTTAWGSMARIDCKWFNPSLISRISARNNHSNTVNSNSTTSKLVYTLFFQKNQVDHKTYTRFIKETNHWLSPLSTWLPFYVYKRVHLLRNNDQL